MDFDWASGSPDEARLGTDYFLARWEGFIQPLFTDTFNFHLITNDGSRLWIDNQLLVDAWFGQGTTEYTGHLFLEKEKYYPIKLEFFEAIGDATVQLLWSASQVERSVIPSSQLFPTLPVLPFEGDEMEVAFFPNPVSDNLTLQFGSPAYTVVDVSVFNAIGQLVFFEKKEVPEGYSEMPLSFEGLGNGVYFVRVEGGFGSRTLEVFVQK